MNQPPPPPSYSYAFGAPPGSSAPPPYQQANPYYNQPPYSNQGHPAQQRAPPPPAGPPGQLSNEGGPYYGGAGGYGSPPAPAAQMSPAPPGYMSGPVPGQGRPMMPQGGPMDPYRQPQNGGEGYPGAPMQPQPPAGYQGQPRAYQPHGPPPLPGMGYSEPPGPSQHFQVPANHPQLSMAHTGPQGPRPYEPYGRNTMPVQDQYRQHAPPPPAHQYGGLIRDDRPPEYEYDFDEGPYGGGGGMDPYGRPQGMRAPQGAGEVPPAYGKPGGMGGPMGSHGGGYSGVAHAPRAAHPAPYYKQPQPMQQGYMQHGQDTAPPRADPDWGVARGARDYEPHKARPTNRCSVCGDTTHNARSCPRREIDRAPSAAAANVDVGREYGAVGAAGAAVDGAAAGPAASHGPGAPVEGRRQRRLPAHFAEMAVDLGGISHGRDMSLPPPQPLGKPPKPRKQSKRKPHVLLKLVPQPSSYNNNANFNGAGAQPEGAPYSARGGASAAATAPAAGAQPSQTAAPLSGRQTPSQGGAAAAMPVVNTGPHAAKDHAPLGAGAPASVPRETPPSAEVKAEDGTPFRGHEAPQRPEPADAFEEEHEHGEEERGAAFERALSVPPGNGPTRRYFDPFDQSDSDLSDTEDELADVQNAMCDPRLTRWAIDEPSEETLNHFGDLHSDLLRFDGTEAEGSPTVDQVVGILIEIQQAGPRITLRVLDQTKLGRTLTVLTQSPEPRVANLASKICAEWEQNTRLVMMKARHGAEQKRLKLAGISFAEKWKAA